MKDPVCGMDVGGRGDALVYKNKEYRFCCATCRWAFEREPEQYAS